MKKLFGTLLFFAILLAVIWGGATWFLAKETEKQVRNYIENSDETNGAAKLELIDYKKTSFFGARATTQVSTGVPFIDSIISNGKLVTDIQHGPIIITKTGVKFAASRWVSHLDLDSLDEESAALVTELFGDNNPLNAEIWIDFDQNTKYKIQVPALSQEGTANFDIDGLTLTGTQSLKDNKGIATLKIQEMHLQDPTLEAIIPNVTAELDIQGFISSQMLGTSKVSAPEIKLKPATGGGISFDLDATTDSQAKGDEVSGLVKMTATNVVEPSGIIKNVNYDMDYQGLSATGLNELNNIEAKLNNLQSQLAWNAENTQTPEGQDKMMSIIGQMEDTSKQMLKIIFDKVLIEKKAEISQSLLLSGDKGNSSLDSNFVYTGGDSQSIDINKFMLGDISQILQMLAGTLAINIDKSMLPEQIAMIIKLAAPKGVIKEENNKLSLNASITDGKITLNGETMTLDELIAKFNPKPANLNDANSSLPLPADIAQRIEAEGLTPEIMQDIEESDDIDPEVVKQLKELQHLMESVDAVPPEIPADGGEPIPANISDDLPIEDTEPAPAQ